MGKLPNRIVTNRKSPSNEQAYIDAYKSINKNAAIQDGLDIAAVRTKSGQNGHALMDPSINRSKDKGRHIGQAYISDVELKKAMKK